MQQYIRLTWVMLVLFCAGIMLQTIMLSGYLFFNKSFTSTFCENTNRAEWKCNGSCAAMKVLQLDENNDQESQSTSQEIESIKFLDQLVDCEIPLPNASTDISGVVPDQNFLPTGFSRQIDYPPAC
jgi:hypothetical protein